MKNKIRTLRCLPAILFITLVLLNVEWFLFLSNAFNKRVKIVHPLCQQTFPQPFPSFNRINPRYALGMKSPSRSMLIYNATILTGDGVISPMTSIYFERGTIQQLGLDLDFLHLNLGENGKLNAHKRFLTPGLIDMHSHVGLDSWPEFAATSDTNEMSESVVYPQLKSLDGFK
jgi:hypothetical protein